MQTPLDAGSRRATRPSRARKALALITGTVAVAASLTATSVGTAAAAVRVSIAPGSEIAIIAKRLGPHSASVNECTVGFIATDGAGRKVAITAGHCGRPGEQVAARDLSGGNALIVVGRVARSTTPPTKKGPNGALEAADPNVPDWATITFIKGVPISDSAGPVHPTRVGRARIGDPVCHDGITTGWRCGHVVDVSGHRVLTDIALRPGDSGGPFIRTTDGAALGIASTSDRPLHQKPGGKEYSEFNDLGFILRAAGLQLAT
ncbi:S1 family peptidase [Tsukamurella soli]|uniref:Trypsin n=1 Tax=Tsukamurella soli TaxID=644556 RepID=A0ABP8K3L9_9ACTN